MAETGPPQDEEAREHHESSRAASDSGEGQESTADDEPVESQAAGGQQSDPGGSNPERRASESEPDGDSAPVVAQTVNEDERSPLEHPEHLKTARVFAEIAVESGPDGDLDPSEDRARAALFLLGESLYWVRRALGAPSEVTAVTWFESLDPSLRARVSGDSGLIGQAARALDTDPRGADPIDARNVEALQRFTRSLIHELESPARARERRKALRLTKLAALFLLAVVVVVAAVWHFVVPPDLALTAKISTSSSLKPCVEPTDCGSAVFHTRLQNNPWVIYDLGAEHDLSLLKIHNRSDCCYERAVPLIVETSSDGGQWKQQARRNEVFLNWEVEISAKARYVRLRVPRQTYLHLGPVVIR